MQKKNDSIKEKDAIALFQCIILFTKKDKWIEK